MTINGLDSDTFYPFDETCQIVIWEPEALKNASGELFLEHGVDVRFYTYITDVIREGRRLIN